MAERITGNKKQDIAALQAYYEALRTKKQEKNVEEVKEQQVKPETKEIGEKLLQQPYVNMFAVNSAISKEDERDLKEMFALAGIPYKAPSKLVYERIAANIQPVDKVFRNIETEKNIEELFASTEFETLNNIFFS